jgi:hypothetical protein
MVSSTVQALHWLRCRPARTFCSFNAAWRAVVTKYVSPLLCICRWRVLEEKGLSKAQV